MLTAPLPGPHEIRPIGAADATDLANARRLVRSYGTDIHHVPEWGRWVVWDGRRFRTDVTGEVPRMAKAVTEAILDEARDHRDDRLFRWGIRSQSSASLNNMVTVAATEPTVPVLVTELDAHPMLLTAANVTIDLATGRGRPHQHRDLITRATDVPYDPDATCPTWLAFLEQVIPDVDTRTFIQRAVGYSLTGDVSEQVLFILHGSGANGKSVFAEVLQHVMGDHAAPAPPRLLVIEKHSEHPTAVADLQGRRLVVAQEVEQGHRLDESLVKLLTGGDSLKARFMRQDFWSFKPSHKLWMCVNHKPRIRGTDHGIWRRIRLVPFTTTIPDDAQDKHLAARLKREAPGILAWAVRGCLDWQRHGLGIPTAVAQATDAYRLEQDLVGQYLAENTITGAGCSVRSTVLYEAYVAWCSANGLDHPLSQKALAQQLSERGYEHGKNRQMQAVWRGLGLLDDRLAFGCETP